ncbi:MAG: LysM peptidoglycan-binding domain-containing protein [Phycisphaerae bacterium]
MRMEYKAALAVGLVVLVGSAIWWSVGQSGGNKKLDTIPLNKKVADAKPSGVGLASDPRKTQTPSPAQPAGVTPPRPTPSTTPPGATPASPVTSLPPLAPATPATRPASTSTDSSMHPVTPATMPAVSLTPRSEPPSAPVTTPAASPPGAITSPAAPPVSVAPRRDDQPMTPARPSPPSTGSTTRPAGGDGKYTIKAGDTYGVIAKAEYGDERLWAAIEVANPGVDPKRLRIGQVINLPPKEKVRASSAGATPTSPAPSKPDAKPPTSQPAKSGTTPPSTITPGATTRPAARATYVVADGDTLMSIARNVLKDESRWKEILELNKDKLSSPEKLMEGMEIRLPPPRESVNGTSGRSGESRRGGPRSAGAKPR